MKLTEYKCNLHYATFSQSAWLWFYERNIWQITMKHSLCMVFLAGRTLVAIFSNRFTSIKKMNCIKKLLLGDSFYILLLFIFGLMLAVVYASCGFFFLLLRTNVLCLIHISFPNPFPCQFYFQSNLILKIRPKL